MAIRKKLLHWELAGFLTACAAGTLLQYLFDWSGKNTFVAAFSAVNESTWEHMKLLYVPFFVFAMIEYAVFCEPFRNFFAAKAAAALVGLAAIPTLYYTLNGALGKTPDWVNIAIFFVSAAAAYLAGFLLLRAYALRGAVMQLAGFVLLWALMLLFVLFTYRTPELPLFLDPVTLRYGIPR
ncbi:MAG: hypothetical protein IJU66_00285 [Oscillospiraceae bacterium]|nr:hypothetical protein [Oscillospiraceae bacterium]